MLCGVIQGHEMIWVTTVECGGSCRRMRCWDAADDNENVANVGMLNVRWDDVQQCCLFCVFELSKGGWVGWNWTFFNVVFCFCTSCDCIFLEVHSKNIKYKSTFHWDQYSHAHKKSQLDLVTNCWCGGPMCHDVFDDKEFLVMFEMIKVHF